MRYNFLKLYVLVSVGFCLSGCQRIWYFSITDITNPMYPTFCFSSRKNCNGSGINFSSLIIYEVDNNTNHVKKVWGLICNENVQMHNVEYGLPPKGFEEIIKAEPLKIDTLYSVNGAYYFKFHRNNKMIRSEIYNLKEIQDLK